MVSFNEVATQAKGEPFSFPLFVNVYNLNVEIEYIYRK